MYRHQLILALVLPVAGCGLLFDPDPPLSGSDAGVFSDSAMLDSHIQSDGPVMIDGSTIDAGVPPIDCGMLPDGTVCGDDPRQICSSGGCIASHCGDAIVDPGTETCDDGNTEDGDGCDSDCTRTCEHAADCDDGNFCNGAETCTPMGCAPGTNITADICMNAMGGMGRCEAGFCVPDACGNGKFDSGEQCDDGNTIPGDGCEPDCTFTCEDDSDCSGTTGDCRSEGCDTSTHTCAIETLPVLYACFADADRDGWGAGEAIPSCRATCPVGTSPLDGDCDDADARAHPFTGLFYTRPTMGTRDYDYNCDGVEEPRLPTRSHVLCAFATLGGRCRGSGWVGSAPSCGGTGIFVECNRDSTGGTDTCLPTMLETAVACR
jgi:cysteine-rich repeat protein